MVELRIWLYHAFRLDVYKRQVTGRAGGHDLDLGGEEVLLLDVVPVSYTHLDVYKRQPLVFGSFILTIVGIVMMSAAASKQSVGLSLVGYVIFASTFGLTASFGLANYDLPTINTAFIATAAITFVFGALGVTFPKFFQRVYGIGFGILLATILVKICLLYTSRCV